MKPEEFGPFLAEQRKIKGLSQYELAEKLNVTVSAVSKWERCKCLPDIAKLEDLAGVLELSIGEIFYCKVNCPEKQISKQDEMRLLEDYKKLQRKEKKKEEMVQLRKWVFAACIAVVITICLFLLRNNISRILREIFNSQEVVIDSTLTDGLPAEVEEAYKKSRNPPIVQGIAAFMAVCFTGGLMLVNPNFFWQLKFFFADGNELSEAPDGYKFISRICGIGLFCAGVLCLMAGLGL